MISFPKKIFNNAIIYPFHFLFLYVQLSVWAIVISSKDWWKIRNAGQEVKNKKPEKFQQMTLFLDLFTSKGKQKQSVKL